MLIQFSVENFLSFKNEVILSLLPAKSRTMKDHIIKDYNGKKIEVLPLLTIYGANASGKSNLVSAISYMKKMVINGTKPDSSTEIIPYKLDDKSETQPSRFEIIFKHNSVIYTYGFVISKFLIHEEWLFAYYTSQESKIFERITKDNETTVSPGNKLLSSVKKADFIKFIAMGTRPNQLFLTEANSKNIEILKPIHHWISEHLQIIHPNSQYRLLTIRAHKEHNFLEYLSKFLKSVDTGINQIKCESEPLEDQKHLSRLPKTLQENIKDAINKKNVEQILIQTHNKKSTICIDRVNNSEQANFLKLQTEHLKADGSATLFDIEEESDGTRRLMDLVPMLTDILEDERVFIIDELDRSLHTHLSRLFIQTFINSVSKNKSRGQFIMTTHDTNLLDRNLLRKDEIWFMEKDQHGASHLTNLAEYKINEGLNYENGYLNGRFGAIPFIGNVSDLFE